MKTNDKKIIKERSKAMSIQLIIRIVTEFFSHEQDDDYGNGSAMRVSAVIRYTRGVEAKGINNA